MSGDLFRNKYRIASARAYWHDYNHGYYFITICTNKREHFFGEIHEHKMELSKIGDFANSYVDKINATFKDAQILSHVIMPNHVHAIIILEYRTENQQHTISEIVQTFKRHSTVEYINLVKQCIVQPFDKKLWQRSFHDHIIRNEKGYKTISDYIKNNPFMWEQDVFHVDT